MERTRLVELQNHGEEVKELKRSKSESVALYRQLEQKVTQKETEITRLQRQCQDLMEMVIIIMSIYILHGFMAVYNSVRVRSDVSI